MKRKIFSILFTLVLVLSFSLVTAVPVMANTDRLVPSQYATIQLAIDAADPGDTIIVAAGDYNEVVNIYKSNLVVKSASGAEVTTIVAASAVATVDFIGASPEFGLVENSVLDGFTVINEFMGGPFPVVVRFQHASGCVAKNNVIIGPSTDTVPHMSGVVMSGEHNATINNILENSTISNCWNGFVVFGPGADGNTIRNNIVEENSNGAWIEYETKNTVVQGNDIINNILLGIGIDEQYWNPSVNILINYNNIYGNGFGIKADYQVLTTPVNATHNWWDDASGPEDTTGTNEVPPCTADPTTEINADGIGDEVSDNVDYCPWLVGRVIGGKTETTQTDDPDTVDATTEADVKVIKRGEGTPTITVAEYEDNPGDGFTGDIGKYIDVHIDDDTNVTEIEIWLYYTDDEIEGLNEASLKLYWWDGSAWTECSDSGVNPDDTNSYSGYIWAKIRTDTNPTLDDLTGTPFGGGRPPVVGGTVYPIDKVSIVMPWIGLAVALALAGVFGARLAHRKLRG